MRIVPDISGLCLIGLLTAFAITPSALSGQQPQTGRVVGMVLATPNRAPVVGAIVTVEGIPRVSALTGGDGGFALSGIPSGMRTLRVERIGFGPVAQDVDVPPSGNVEVEILLEERAIDLEGLIVTATLDSRSQAEALRATGSLSGRELDRALGVTVAKTLENEPGVSAVSMGPATGRPVIRGLGGDRILILEDGERTGDVSSTSPDHTVSTDASSADRVEVVRGPAALFYGSNALGGVVNVIREEIPREPTERVTGRVSLQGQSVYSGGAAAGDVVLPVGGFLARAEGSYRVTGDVDTPLGPLANSDIETWSASGGLSRVRDWGHVGASVRAFSSSYGIPPDTVSGHPSGVQVEVDRTAVRGEADLTSGLGPFEHAILSGGYTTYDHQEVEASGEVGTAFDQQTVFAEVQGHHEELGPLGSGGVGLRAEQRDYLSNNGRDVVDTHEVSLAVYGVEEWTRGRLTLQAGARFDHRSIQPRDVTTVRGVDARDRTFNEVSTSLAALFEVVEDVRLGLNLARSVRTPSSEELFSQGPHLAAYAFEVGNPDLEPEAGLGLDAFVRVSRPTLTAELVGFTTSIRDFSYTANTGEQRGSLFVYRYVNTDARFTGAESSVEWSPMPGWAFGGMASLVRATNTGLDEPLPLIPPLHGRLSARREHDLWFVEGSLDWAARQDRLPVRPDLPENSAGYCDEVPSGDPCRPVPGDYLPTAGYATVGLSTGYRWIRGSTVHALTLRVENATDATYRNHLSRLKELVPEPGIGVSLLYRLAF